MSVCNMDEIMFENFFFVDIYCLINKKYLIFGNGFYFCLGVFFVWFEMKIILEVFLEVFFYIELFEDFELELYLIVLVMG